MLSVHDVLDVGHLVLRGASPEVKCRRLRLAVLSGAFIRGPNKLHSVETGCGVAAFDDPHVAQVFTVRLRRWCVGTARTRYLTRTSDNRFSSDQPSQGGLAENRKTTDCGHNCCRNHYLFELQIPASLSEGIPTTGCESTKPTVSCQEKVLLLRNYGKGSHGSRAGEESHTMHLVQLALIFSSRVAVFRLRFT